MAEETAKTEYRIFRKLSHTELEQYAAGTTAGEVYVLEPNTYTGNVKRAVFDDLGEGEYVKIAARSLDPFVARTKAVVTFTAGE